MTASSHARTPRQRPRAPGGLSRAAALLSVTLAIAPTLMLGGCAARAPSATAQRSSFSTDSVTTAPGTVELELGGGVGPNSDRAAVLAVKYGLDPRSEVYVCAAPYLRARPGRRTRHGRSATDIGWRHRFHETPDGAAGVQIAARLPDGSHADGLASGESELFLGGILDGRNEHLAWTLFYQLGSLGDAGSDRDTQHALGVVLGAPLSEELDGFVEVFGESTRARGEHPLAAQLGVAWNHDPTRIYDLALQLGLNDDAAHTQLLFGVTWNLGAP